MTFQMSDLEPSLSIRVKNEAQKLGFDLVGIAPAVSPTTLPQFQDWVRQGFDGEMHYIQRRAGAYEHPQHVLATVRSVIVVALNYFSDPVPHQDYRIARYAAGNGDYHLVIKQRLQQLANFLHVEKPGCRTRPVVDTAPLLERDFARLAGLGWFGKNTMLINKQRGSWLFLGALLTDVELDADRPHATSHCGTCTRCLEACPTQAFVAPYVLDARRCISYLTIELRDDPIPEDLRTGVEDWVFGCDVCQEVCPWNRHATPTSVSEFQRADALHPATLADFLGLTEAQFSATLSQTPMERAGRRGLVRNAAIAAGNSKDVSLVPILHELTNDSDELVRDAALWAVESLKS